MNQDRDFLTIKGQRVRHTTAQRDWVCGQCGSRLVTFYDVKDDCWTTRCFQSREHDNQSFVHSSTWAYTEARRMMKAIEAKDVFAHLPPEMQAAITQ